MTDRCDCRVVRTWNEQSDGDYVGWRDVREAVGAQTDENDSKVSRSIILLRFKFRSNE